jgi:hypothetical protein
VVLSSRTNGSGKATGGCRHYASFQHYLSQRFSVFASVNPYSIDGFLRRFVSGTRGLNNARDIELLNTSNHGSLVSISVSAYLALWYKSNSFVP